MTSRLTLLALALTCATAIPLGSSIRSDNLDTRSSASSTSSLQYNPAGATCYDVEIPLEVSIDGYEWIGPRWIDDYGLIDFVATQAGRKALNDSQLFQPAVAGGNYSISGTFCIPDDGGERATTVLLATHGLWYDRNYWSLPFDPDTYNFAQRAISQGYSLFMYDRLGVGLSSKISGYESQALLQVEVLRQLAGIVQANTYTADHLRSIDKTVLVGHAYGAVLNAQLLQLYPDIADAVILETLALSLNAAVSDEAFTPRVARLQNPERFGYADTGFLTWVDRYSAIDNNFKYGFYTLEAVDWLEENKTPHSISEQLTQGLSNLNATEFAGPTFVINGEFASTVCDGYCPGVTQDAFEGVWTAASPLDISIVDGCAHSLHLCSKASSIYDQIFDFLSGGRLIEYR